MSLSLVMGVQMQSTFFRKHSCLQFTVRDSFTNVGPLKDFSYGLRINVDANASGITKSESNYELPIKFGEIYARMWWEENRAKIQELHF
ncbi:hypothetical protein CRYUN_Cryun26dG0033900 [Craigia yunnanensis]